MVMHPDPHPVEAPRPELVRGPASGQGLIADFRLRHGDLHLELQLSVGPGEVVALLGPNGAGKTTTVRTLAGLLQPEHGRISLAGTVLDDVETGRHLPAFRRRIGVVFQDYLLFPHLTVLDNVAFGPRSAGSGRAASRRTARQHLDRLNAGDLAGLRPAQLSGGQAQRVALARALAGEPDLLLLDEPLAALDARTRLTVRGELRRQVAGFGGAAIVITHDPTDAAVLADRLVVIEDGRLVQTGTPGEVARRPRTDYVARLVGLNLVSGRATGHQMVTAEGTMITTAHPATGRVFAAFAPSAVALWRSRPDGSPRNLWPVSVLGLEPYGDGVRVEVGTAAERLVAEVTPAAVAALGIDVGLQMWATVKASEIEVYPAD